MDQERQVEYLGSGGTCEYRSIGQIFKATVESILKVSSPAEIYPSAHVKQGNYKHICLIYAEITSAGDRADCSVPAA